MSVAIFPTPIAGSSAGSPVLVIGIFHNEGFNPSFLVIGSEGGPRSVESDTLVLDLRYDWSRQTWVDVSGDVDEPAEEATDYGGEAVPGQFPEYYGAHRGDPSDGEDGTVGSLDTSETEPG